MQYFLLPLLLLFSSLLYGQQPVASPDGDTLNIEDSYTWTLVKDRAGIKVYMRTIEGTDRKEVKAMMELAVPFTEVAKLVNTSAKNPEWIDVFRTSENITPESGDTYYEYSVLDLPFLSSDRDLYLRINYIQTQTGFLRTCTSVPAHKPATPGYVRMEVFNGYWAGMMIDPTHTRVTHTVCTAPGGNTSEKFANNFVAGASFKTMTSLREKLETPELTQNTQTGRRKRRG